MNLFVSILSTRSLVLSLPCKIIILFSNFLNFKAYFHKLLNYQNTYLYFFMCISHGDFKFWWNSIFFRSLVSANVQLCLDLFGWSIRAFGQWQSRRWGSFHRQNQLDLGFKFWQLWRCISVTTCYIIYWKYTLVQRFRPKSPTRSLCSLTCRRYQVWSMPAKKRIWYN